MTFRWFDQKARTGARAGARAGLRAAGEHILEEANRTVPLREGVLQATGSVDSDESQAVISYDGPYARRQHEEMTYRHAPGRRAKWLQLTVQERASAVVGYLERALRGAIR